MVGQARYRANLDRGGMLCPAERPWSNPSRTPRTIDTRSSDGRGGELPVGHDRSARFDPGSKLSRSAFSPPTAPFPRTAGIVPCRIGFARRFFRSNRRPARADGSLRRCWRAAGSPGGGPRVSGGYRRALVPGLIARRWVRLGPWLAVDQPGGHAETEHHGRRKVGGPKAAADTRQGKEGEAECGNIRASFWRPSFIRS